MTFSQSGTVFEQSLTSSEPMMSSPEMHVGWVDGLRMTREAFGFLIGQTRPTIVIIPFETVRCCIKSTYNLDVIVYHDHTSDMSAADQIASLQSAFVTVPILVLADTQRLDRDLAATYREQGAYGIFDSRSLNLDLFVCTMRFAQQGGILTLCAIDGEVDAAILGESRDRTGVLPEPEPEVVTTPFSALTERELGVLLLLKEGTANKIIAYKLEIQECTVKAHVRHIIHKMGCTNRTQAAYKALKMESVLEDRLREIRSSSETVRAVNGGHRLPTSWTRPKTLERV